MNYTFIFIAFFHGALASGFSQGSIEISSSIDLVRQEITVLSAPLQAVEQVEKWEFGRVPDIISNMKLMEIAKQEGQRIAQEKKRIVGEAVGAEWRRADKCWVVTIHFIAIRPLPDTQVDMVPVKDDGLLIHCTLLPNGALVREDKRSMSVSEREALGIEQKGAKVNADPFGK